MKGSAFKLNNVATKSALKSPLEHEAVEGEISPQPGEGWHPDPKVRESGVPYDASSAKSHNKTYGTPKHHDDPRKGKRTSEMDDEFGSEMFGYEDETNVLPMKSPAKQDFNITQSLKSVEKLRLEEKKAKAAAAKRGGKVLTKKAKKKKGTKQKITKYN